MSQFRYVAFTKDGVRETGRLEASDSAQAWVGLSGLGLTVVELSVDTGKAPPPAIPWMRRKAVPLSAQAELAEQLAALYAARLSETEIARILADGAALPEVRRKFQRASQLMADGQPFPEALATVGDGLSPLFVSLARVAHASGDPVPMMQTLASTLRRQEKIAAQLVSALIYPAILIIGGLFVFALMAVVLAPRIATIFTSIDRPIPMELGFFVSIGEFLVDWGLWLVLGVVALCLATPSILARQGNSAGAMMTKLPLVGPILRDASLSRMARSLQLMLTAGMPLARALLQSSESMPRNPYGIAFRDAGAKLEAGGSAHEVFLADRTVPKMFSELFAIGERTNTLPGILVAVASSLEDRVERQSQRAMTLVAPFLTLVIGGSIAGLVYAVMSALLSVNDLAF